MVTQGGVVVRSFPAVVVVVVCLSLRIPWGSWGLGRGAKVSPRSLRTFSEQPWGHLVSNWGALGSSGESLGTPWCSSGTPLETLEGSLGIHHGSLELH